MMAKNLVTITYLLREENEWRKWSLWSVLLSVECQAVVTLCVSWVPHIYIVIHLFNFLNTMLRANLRSQLFFNLQLRLTVRLHRMRDVIRVLIFRKNLTSNLQMPEKSYRLI